MKSPGDPPAIPNHPLAARASAEAVGTFALVLVGCGAIVFDEITDGALSRLATALAIGGAVGAGALVGGPWTGASMNPARSLGPALWTSSAPDQWIYVAGPLLGALAAIAVFARFRRP